MKNFNTPVTYIERGNIRGVKTNSMKHKYLLFFVISILQYSCSQKKSIETVNLNETLIIYMAADNNLKDNALLNLFDMVDALNKEQKVIVFLDKGDQNSYLLELSPEKGTSIYQQVIKEYPLQNSAKSETLHQVLKEIITKYPSDQYGLILWSHGTSWFPSQNKRSKSFGIERNSTIEITDLASSLPCKFNYILFDACLMGSVEVASELEYHTDYLVASPTDILTSGMPYKEIIPILLNKKSPIKNRLIEVCKAYINHYDKNIGTMKSASISLYDLKQINKLQNTVKQIIRSNSEVKIKANKVQKLNLNLDCYDLVDMVRTNYGLKASKKIEKSIKPFILYHRHTKKFMNSLSLINSHGISCYIPLDNSFSYFYNNLKWTKSTEYDKAIFNK